MTSASRWLDDYEERAIIDFIRANPGRSGREIANYLGYPKRSVNGFLYRYGIANGVENHKYRWYPQGLIIQHEPLLITPPMPEPVTTGPPEPEWGETFQDIETNVDNAGPDNFAPVSKQSGWSRMGCLYAGLFLLALVLLAKAATGAEVVQIRSCYDGDTCTTTTGEKVRLACIDTPELKGKNARPAPAMAAKYHLNGMLMGQTVGIRRITTDRFGRTVAELFIDGTNVQQAMVASGHAEIFWKYANECPWTR